MKRGRGRPRREGADEEILAVALEMLREKGYRDLTVDAVAERAGVAKTTIYRRWPTKGALIAAAIAPIAPSATDDILRDAKAMLDLIAGVDDVEVLRAVVEKEHRRLRDVLGASADAALGELLVRFLLARRD